MTDDATERAIAFSEMHECIEAGDPIGAQSLARRYDIALERVWAPEDDGIEDRASASSTPLDGTRT